jgi:hypothetical protein
LPRGAMEWIDLTKILYREPIDEEEEELEEE